MRTKAFILLAAALLASCSSSAAPPSPSPGILAGVVLGHTGSSNKQTPIADTQVGVFRQAVSIFGPAQVNPPKPIATATTNSNGVFEIRTLPAGRFFVIALSAYGPGAWVQFDPATGASVTLVVCTDCPVPV